ncbi:50s ribosomal protein l17 [Curvularia clavata]|uniref:50s ribosomal protein l17 n=1 Tax=Curvularia clavata TaxID=95742 RepID=A0A9Q8Z7L3_CURCL|nr:50s ribosomal protein l17 [Curvularia clavata]
MAMSGADDASTKRSLRLVLDDYSSTLHSNSTYPSQTHLIKHNGFSSLYVSASAPVHTASNHAIAPFQPQSRQEHATDSSPLIDLPPVKPSAIALGTAFNHAVSLAVLGPIFGDAYRRAQQANSKEEYFHSKEAATAAASWGSSIVGSGIQAYGVGALINATGTLTYKGAAYLGSLIFFASAAPSIVSQIVTEKRPVDTIAIGAVARVLETVGLSLFLTYWGTRTNPFD